MGHNIDFPTGLPLVGSRLLARPESKSGVTAKQVDGPNVGLGVVNHRFYRVLISDIRGHRYAADCVGGTVGLGGIDIDCHHLSSTLANEALYQRLAYATTGTGDDNNFVSDIQDSLPLLRPMAAKSVSRPLCSHLTIV